MRASRRKRAPSQKAIAAAEDAAAFKEASKKSSSSSHGRANRSDRISAPSDAGLPPARDPTSEAAAVPAPEATAADSRQGEGSYS